MKFLLPVTDWNPHYVGVETELHPDAAMLYPFSDDPRDDTSRWGGIEILEDTTGWRVSQTCGLVHEDVRDLEEAVDLAIELAAETLDCLEGDLLDLREGILDGMRRSAQEVDALTMLRIDELVDSLSQPEIFRPVVLADFELVSDYDAPDLWNPYHEAA